MEDFLTIVHPISKNRISIFSSPGRNLLKSYLQTYKSGGKGIYGHYGTPFYRKAPGNFLSGFPNLDEELKNKFKTLLPHQKAEFLKNNFPENNNELEAADANTKFESGKPFLTDVEQKSMGSGSINKRLELAVLAYPEFFKNNHTRTVFPNGYDNFTLFSYLSTPKKKGGLRYNEKFMVSAFSKMIDINDKKQNPFYGIKKFMFKEQLEAFPKKDHTHIKRSSPKRLDAPERPTSPKSEELIASLKIE